MFFTNLLQEKPTENQVVELQGASTREGLCDALAISHEREVIVNANQTLHINKINEHHIRLSCHLRVRQSSGFSFFGVNAVFQEQTLAMDVLTTDELTPNQLKMKAKLFDQLDSWLASRSLTSCFRCGELLAKNIFDMVHEMSAAIDLDQTVTVPDLISLVRHAEEEQRRSMDMPYYVL